MLDRDMVRPTRFPVLSFAYSRLSAANAPMVRPALSSFIVRPWDRESHERTTGDCHPEG